MKAYYKSDLTKFAQETEGGLNRILLGDLPDEGVIRDGVTETIMQQFWDVQNDTGAGADTFKRELQSQLARHLKVATDGVLPQDAVAVSTQKTDWTETIQEWFKDEPSVLHFIPREEMEVVCKVKNDRKQRCYLVPVRDGLMIYSKAVNLGTEPTADELFKASALAAKNQYKFAMGIENVGGEWELRVGTHVHERNITKEQLIFKVGWVASIADYLEHVYQGTDEF
jgi:hypothetical protein